MCRPAAAVRWGAQETPDLGKEELAFAKVQDEADQAGATNFVSSLELLYRCGRLAAACVALVRQATHRRSDTLFVMCVCRCVCVSVCLCLCLCVYQLGHHRTRLPNRARQVAAPGLHSSRRGGCFTAAGCTARVCRPAAASGAGCRVSAAVRARDLAAGAPTPRDWLPRRRTCGVCGCRVVRVACKLTCCEWPVYRCPAVQLGDDAGVVQSESRREHNEAALAERALLQGLSIDEATLAADAAPDARNEPPPANCLATDTVGEEQLYQQDRDVKLLDAVVGWLAAAAADKCWHQEQEEDGMWAATRAKMREGGGLVTQLDPDAPARQKKRLVAADEEQEAEFLQSLWQVRGPAVVCVGAQPRPRRRSSRRASLLRPAVPRR